jgi:branched-chain amino acid transport system substrate-binding protein
MLRLGKFSFVFMTLLCGQTLAQTSGMVRIGVMNDMAGVYSDDQGPGSVLAAQLAVEDHGSQTSVNSRACEQPNQAKIEARHYINELLGANQTFPSHGENRGSSP